MLGDPLEPHQSGLPADLDELWGDFRRSLARRGRSPETVELYRRKFVAFWRWALAEGIEPDPAAVDHRTLNAYYDHLAATPIERNGSVVMTTEHLTGDPVPKLPEASTLRITWRNLRPFFSWWASEFEQTNPFHKADAPGDDRPSPVPVVDLDDVRRLLTVCAGKDLPARRDSALVRVFVDTGARLGEMSNLRLEDWNRRTDVLTLRGKTGTRGAPISASTGEALARYVRERKQHSAAGLPALWLGGKGRLGPSGIAQVLRRRCEEAGIEHINPHRFRHTWAHQFRARGGGEGDLAHLAGWSSTAMAQRYGSSAAAERAMNTARAIALGDEL